MPHRKDSVYVSQIKYLPTNIPFLRVVEDLLSKNREEYIERYKQTNREKALVELESSKQKLQPKSLNSYLSSANETSENLVQLNLKNGGFQRMLRKSTPDCPFFPIIPELFTINRQPLNLNPKRYTLTLDFNARLVTVTFENNSKDLIRVDLAINFSDLTAFNLDSEQNALHFHSNYFRLQKRVSLQADPDAGQLAEASFGWEPVQLGELIDDKDSQDTLEVVCPVLVGAYDRGLEHRRELLEKVHQMSSQFGAAFTINGSPYVRPAHLDFLKSVKGSSREYGPQHKADQGTHNLPREPLDGGERQNEDKTFEETFSKTDRAEFERMETVEMSSLA